MKLRNKKTGKIVKLEKILFKNAQTEDLLKWNTYEPNVNSIAELNEDWEDYKPAEPLIKDEKTRKAVRAWAEANDYDTVLYDKVKDCIYSPYGSDETDTSVSINFDLDCLLKGLENRRTYTITELCGEVEND